MHNYTYTIDILMSMTYTYKGNDVSVGMMPTRHSVYGLIAVATSSTHESSVNRPVNLRH